MKLKFDSSLDYQKEAISAVCDVFQGQMTKQTLFSVVPVDLQQSLCYVGEAEQKALKQGIGNCLQINRKDILSNIRAVQRRHDLPLSETLGKDINLDVEMETGTGKTYVYLRTIFELNKSYGFTKFIIVVPSIAIKEGVQKNLEITQEHFHALYDNVNYDAFIYEGKHVDKIHDFAISSTIQIMVITISAFQKDDNIINNYNDRKFGEWRPIDLVRETNPIVIIDEPQTTISTDAQVEAVRSLNPMCTIRYSATPNRVENKIYKLDAVASFEKKLVKGIEVDSFVVKDAHNEAYLRLISVNNKKMPITARIEMDVKNRKGEIRRKTVTIKQGDDIYEKSGGRDVYEGYIVQDICCAVGNESVDFTSKSDILRIGQPLGTIHADEMKRQQIRATIEEHLNKELELNPKGIKVLSLFFIDRVANYRTYDAAGNPQKGKYAQWFEEVYCDIIRRPKYHDLFHSLYNEEDTAEFVHDGYFSADKGTKRVPGHWKDTSGATVADDTTYSLIMKDKERLLSFSCNVRFIFSHSALREGWDNPNVFQICTLNETNSTVKKRQEIGRGLRLCVNQQGERQFDPSVNILTVLANESYDTFASALQREYEEDGIHFKELPIYNKRERSTAKLNKRVFLSDGFKALWEQIKWKTWYHVKFSKDKLLDACRRRMMTELVVPSEKIIHMKTELHIGAEGINTRVVSDRKVDYHAHDNALPDIISYLQNETNLTRRTIVEFLTGMRKQESGTWEPFDAYGNRLQDFRKNPQAFMEKSAAILRSEMQSLIVDGISYHKIGDTEYYCQELFKTEELKGYLESNMIESKKSVYNHIVYDSANERDFAIQFEQNRDVLLYVKLPAWFKIPTPLGSYNPDWAVLIKQNSEKKFYFVLETKGNIDWGALRPTENKKIECGKKHFSALDNQTQFRKIDDFTTFMENLEET